MKVKCPCCHEWEAKIAVLELAVELASAGAATLEELDMRRCPWCGTALIEPEYLPPESMEPATGPYIWWLEGDGKEPRVVNVAGVDWHAHARRKARESEERKNS